MAQPQRPGGFDMARASTGAKVILVAAILLFIDLFFPWQGVDLGEFGEAIGVSGNVSGFSGLGVLVAILCIAVIAWEIMLMAGVNINLGTTSPVLVSAILAGVTAAFTIIAFLTKLDAIKWGAFVGLILALVLGYGAYMRYTESRTTAPPPPPAA
jgi:hypothetical protein